MTNEEAIEVLENGKWWGMLADVPCDRKEILKFHKALDMAIAALRAQQKPVKLDRSRWEGCGCCTAGDGGFRELLDKWGYPDYCPKCGRPLTEEAWVELERRIGGNDDD